nr:phospholipase-like protein [Tanacetum cinerariifolium]
KKQEAEQRRLRLQLMLEEENNMKSIDRSNPTHMKLALEKCKTTNRRYVNVLRIPMEFLSSSRWHHCKFPWCNDVVVDRPFWDSLIRLDDNRLGWLHEEVFISINEPNRHWSLAKLHIKSRNVTFYNSQETFDVEIRPWYVKIRRCLESKIPVVLQETGVFVSKGIDPTHYSINFRHAQNILKQGGVFGDCGVFFCLFLYRLAHGIQLDVEDPIQTILAYREKMINFFFDHKIIFPS